MKNSMMCYVALAGSLIINTPLGAAESDIPDLGGPAVVDDGSGNTLDDAIETEESSAPNDLLAVPEPPEIPEAVRSGEALEPEVTIVQRGENTVEEFRINGRLFKIRITPSSGPPYYLIDTDGDGLLETRRDNDITDINIPQWVLFSW